MRIGLLLLALSASACAGPRKEVFSYCSHEAPSGACGDWTLGVRTAAR